MWRKSSSPSSVKPAPGRAHELAARYLEGLDVTSEAVQTTVESFFASYRSAFERRDIAAIEEHFGDAVHVASDTGSGVHAQYVSRADWRRVIEQLVSQYQALDVAAAETRSLQVTSISDRLVQAHVSWALSSRSGSLLYEFAAAYTLACEGQRCRIVALAHDEIAQARRARRQGQETVDRGSP